jgi:magnesium-transporting ATPase (P-type)
VGKSRWTPAERDQTATLEIALLEAVGDAQVRRIRDAQRRLGSLPFDASRRRTVTVNEGIDTAIAVLKGAPEVVLGASVNAIDRGGGRGPLAGDAVLRSAEELATSGSRVIAFAVREGRDVDPDRPPEEGFTFLAS